jgi:hypothetical protein
MCADCAPKVYCPRTKELFPNPPDKAEEKEAGS